MEQAGWQVKERKGSHFYFFKQNILSFNNKRHDIVVKHKYEQSKKYQRKIKKNPKFIESNLDCIFIENHNAEK